MLSCFYWGDLVADKIFGQKKKITAEKAIPRPIFGEMEYTDIAEDDFKRVKKLFTKEMWSVKDAYRDGDRDIWLRREVERAFYAMQWQLEEDDYSKDKERLETVANKIEKRCIRSITSITNDSLGTNLKRKEFEGIAEEIKSEWVREGLNLMMKNKLKYLGKMEERLKDAFEEGMGIRDAVRDCLVAYTQGHRHEILLAKDQANKLVSRLNRLYMERLGVSDYMWITCRDERVRASHRRLDKHLFSWNDPPIVDEKMGRRCHPAEDYGCRCRAKAVFRRGMLNIEEEGGKWKLRH